jgi:tetratricopeptide (TPR) repeat protein
MNTDTLQPLDALKQKIETLLEQGNPSDAVHEATQHVEQCGTQPGQPSALADALETRADLLRRISAHEQAREDYEKAIALLSDDGAHFIQLGRLHAGLGASCDALGAPEKAAEHWGKSIHYFENHNPPAMLDVAAMANNFGFLKKTEGNFDAAETAFLKALEILHVELGEHHEETATVACNLGTLYHDAGHHEPAGKMHRLAMNARSKLFGDEHPETAQSHKYLALVLVNAGEHIEARHHFEKALHAFESLGKAYYDDLNEVAHRYCDLLRADGETDMAEIIANHVRSIIGPMAAA